MNKSTKADVSVKYSVACVRYAAEYSTTITNLSNVDWQG